MATNVPTNIPDLISWCQVHAPLWATNAASIGLTAAQATAFTTLVSSMLTTNGKAQDARQASKDATKQFQSDVTAVRSLAGSYVNSIKAFAETTNNENVYALAGVSPNDSPGTVPTPVPPETFTTLVNPDGSLTVKFKVSQPEGVTNVQYLVSRRVNASSGAFSLITAVGSEKMFTDVTLPVGVDRVEYIVQPKRGEVLGAQSNVLAIQFGSLPDGLTITGTNNVKLAA